MKNNPQGRTKMLSPPGKYLVSSVLREGLWQDGMEKAVMGTGKRRRLSVIYPVVARKDYKDLTPEDIKGIRNRRGETQAQFALALTDICRRWCGVGTVPVAAQSVQQYEVGRNKPGSLIGPAILVLEEEVEDADSQGDLGR